MNEICYIIVYQEADMPAKALVCRPNGNRWYKNLTIETKERLAHLANTYSSMLSMRRMWMSVFITKEDWG